MVYENPLVAINKAREKLYFHGYKIESNRWQSIKAPDPMYETLHYIIQCKIPKIDNLKMMCRPNLPWADRHFEERISGIPHNPPPSHKIWPFAQNGNGKFRKENKFSHTYPERFWPDRLKGIRFEYGNLNDVINLLASEPDTRQAFIPIWYPEDTGAVHRERVPCTLGYHIIQRNKLIYMSYFMRSCDILRHLQDDIYLAMKLLYWIKDKLIEINPYWFEVQPAIFTMHIASLHCFYAERNILKQKLKYYVK